MRVSPTALRWGALVALSLVFGAVLGALRLPGALLIGPMLAAIGLATRGHAVPIPPNLFVAAQGVIGMMIAGFLPLSIGSEIAARWPVFLFGTCSTLFAAAGFGWAMARSRLLPGTTAIWGSSPGAATVMTLMSEQYGADLRLVALMQYLRVACCAAAAALMARVLGTPATTQALPGAATAFDLRAAAATLVVALVAAALGRVSRIPAGPLLASMALGLAAKATGLMTITLPTPVLMICYAFLGWGLGVRFTPDVVGHAARVLPRVLLSIVALIVVCGASGFLLVPLAGVDPLTAFLATSPGGADTATIIAATTKVDAPFVIAMQMVRFFCVLITAPMTARFLSRTRDHAPAA
jgi:membrane AbrB-like protein